MRWAIAILGAVLVVQGCSDDTDIVGSLELGDLVRLDLPEDESLGSIGMIDGWVLVLTQRRVESPPPAWAPSAIDLYVRWLSPENVLGDPIYAGRALGTYRSPRWVREGDSLVGALWETWDPTEIPGDQRRPLRRVAFAPGLDEPTENVTPELPLAVDARYRLTNWSGGEPVPGYEALQPAAAVGRALLFGHGPSMDCPSPFEADDSRLFSVAPLGELAWATPGSLCSPVDPSAWVGAVWALELGEDVGILYRPYPFGSRFAWLRLEGGTTARREAVVVGTLSHESGDFGGQPRGVAVGETVLFIEREAQRDLCYLMHGMRFDGEAVHDTPWQLPCRTARVSHRFVNEPARAMRFVEFLAGGDTAVMVFTDAPNPWLEETSAPAPQIRALALTEAGRRGSEIVAIAPPEASVAEFMRAAGEGADAVVTYLDSAPSRQGWWLRRLRYVPNPA